VDVKRLIPPTPNATGTAIALSDSDDVWHDGAEGPSCVGTDTRRKAFVRLGIVEVDADAGGPGGPRVVWLRCLE
jgi:hypothetical protein